MERRLVAVLGTTAKHILGSLRRAIFAVGITFIITALIAAAATEVAAAFLTKEFPSGATHLAAAALALSFGYAAAVTVFVGEILRAIIKAVELIVEEAEKVERKAVEEIETLSRRAGQEAVQLGRTAVTDAGSFGRAAVGDLGAAGRAVAGVAGGVVGGVERDVRAVEHGVGSHLPGHHNGGSDAVTVSPSNATTLPSADPGR